MARSIRTPQATNKQRNRTASSIIITRSTSQSYQEVTITTSTKQSEYLHSATSNQNQSNMVSLPPPRFTPTNNKNHKNNAHAAAHGQHQPKPKFVAHKNPTQGKKGKEKVSSNRLGNVLHMA
mmetsp:Transcript_25459/g.40046  ORF Transcript_25459/g.40046 Transcript_25459/m.40046 type:complete len:122 (+) Transcript_25459:68-433(+)